MSVNGMARPCSRPAGNRMLGRGAKDKEHAMSQTLNAAIAVVGIDIGKNSFHIVGHDERGAIVLRQKWSRGQQNYLRAVMFCQRRIEFSNIGFNLFSHCIGAATVVPKCHIFEPLQ